MKSMDSTKKHQVEIELSSDESRPMTQSIFAVEETPLLYQLLDHDINVDHSCGGNGSCGTCHYFVESHPENISEIEDVEAELRAERQFKSNERLACQSHVKGPIKIRLP